MRLLLSAAMLLLVLLLGLAGLDQALVGPARSAAPWWPWITSIGDTDTRLVVTLVACGLLWWLRGHLEAMLMLATGVLASFMSWGLKIIVGRQRPPDALVELLSGSFPSGHAMGSTATYVTLAVLAVPGNMRALVAAAALAALVGYSRMALGVHYLSDIAAGWLIGLALVKAADVLRSRIRAAQDAAPRPAGPPPGQDPPGAP